MIRIQTIFLILIAGIIPETRGGAKHHGSVSLNTTYQTWANNYVSSAGGNESAGGSEIVIGTTVQYGLMERLTLGLKSAAAAVRYDPNYSLSSLTDITFSAEYRQPLKSDQTLLIGSLDLGLPTGEPRRNFANYHTRIPERLLEETLHDSGFDVTASFSFVKSWPKTNIGFGVGYSLTGSYYVSGTLGDLNPANILTTNLTFIRAFSKKFEAEAYFSYAFFTTDKLNRQEAFQPGNELTVGSGLFLEFGSLSVETFAEYRLRQKNGLRDTDDIFMLEQQNGNGNILAISGQASYPIFQKIEVRAIGRATLVGANGYNPGLIQYDAGGTVLGGGLGILINLSKKFDFDILTSYDVVQDTDAGIDAGGGITNVYYDRFLLRSQLTLLF